jgi:hypothetical protein
VKILQRFCKAFRFALDPQKNGSAQESVKVCILRGFLETRILVLRSTHRRHLHQNGQNCGFAVEMTLRGTYGGIFAEDFLSVPRSLETRTNRGFPHFHSDYGAGTRFDRKADPAKIAGPVRFLHRTRKTGDRAIK